MSPPTVRPSLSTTNEYGNVLDECKSLLSVGCNAHACCQAFKYNVRPFDRATIRPFFADNHSIDQRFHNMHSTDRRPDMVVHIHATTKVRHKLIKNTRRARRKHERHIIIVEESEAAGIVEEVAKKSKEETTYLRRMSEQHAYPVPDYEI